VLSWPLIALHAALIPLLLSPLQGRAVGDGLLPSLAFSVRKILFCELQLILLSNNGGDPHVCGPKPSMTIVGRLFARFASRIDISVIIVYISEISVLATRGIMAGIQGISITIGYCLANWIGYAREFAHGDAQWSIPLGVRCMGIPLISIAPISLPYTPRWRKF
jgi:Sugar (and other) transporter